MFEIFFRLKKSVNAYIIWTTDTLEYFIEDLKSNPHTLPKKGKEIFSGENWSTWLCQLGFEVSNKNDGISDDQAKEMLDNFYKTETEKRETLIHHTQFLDQFSDMLKQW